VPDASQSVTVVGNLTDPGLKPPYLRQLQTLQERDRKAFAERQQKSLLSYAEAVRRRFDGGWSSVEIAVPAFVGRRVIDNLPLAELVPYIDWSPFFQAWELRGAYPRILDDEVVGVEARKLYADARRLLDEIVQQGLLTARGVYGFWPANSVGDDVVVYNDATRGGELCRFHMLRQQWERKGMPTQLSLADYIAPLDSGRLDYLGAFAVTTGIGIDPLVKKFEADHDDYHSIMTKALADRLAEAFAEYLHAQARRDWGYGAAEALSNEELIDEKYRGIRPAPGYPACPDHTEKRTLFDLLQAEHSTGIHLTESFAMHPAASVSGWYFSHPQSRYFAVDRLTRDQVEQYAERKGLILRECERWLAPNLGYDP
jgi:5-methyltetrahydrofolate--homocysteine methyltransferase